MFCCEPRLRRGSSETCRSRFKWRYGCYLYVFRVSNDVREESRHAFTRVLWVILMVKARRAYQVSDLLAAGSSVWARYMNEPWV